MAWDDLAAQMDDAVDELLGSTIQISFDNGVTYAPVQGFIVPVVSALGIGGIDEPLGSRNRVKLPRSLFPYGLPGRNVRVQHPHLGPGSYQPAGSDPNQQGRYTIFDVQKA